MAEVDVVIPTRDRPSLVPDALRSVLSQTHRQLRAWVVDAGSAPPLSLPDELVSDERVTLVRSDQPVSAGEARNLAVRRGSASFVAFLDDDDRWRPPKLERELSLLAPLPERVAMVASGAEFHHRRGRPSAAIPAPDEDLALQLLWDPVFCPSTSLVRRTALEAVGLFPELTDRTEDWALWLALAERYEVAVLPELLTDRADSETAPERLLAGLAAYHRRVRPRVDRLSPADRRRVLARQEFDRAVLVAKSGRRPAAARMLARSWARHPRTVLPGFHLLRTVTGERVWGLAADYTRAWR